MCSNLIHRNGIVHTIFIICFFIFIHQSVVAADLVINEFLPAPASGSAEWVEFYNSFGDSMDISDYYFDDDTNFSSDTGSSAKVALSGLLPSQATCYWDLSTYLNNNGDSPTLFKTDGSTVDTYTYTQTSTDKSYARIPDGGTWQSNQTPTKSSNKCLDLAPTPTLTPTPLPTATPTPTNTPIPTSTPVPTATQTTTPTPTKTPTQILSKTPTPSATRSPADSIRTDATATGSVLGLSSNDSNPLDSSASTQKNNSLKPLIISFLFIGAGLALIALVLVWQKRNLVKRVY